MADVLPITELKAHLSEILSRVKAGAEVLVTERGFPIARIIPCSDESAGGRLQQLVRQGLANRMPTAIPDAVLDSPPGIDPEGLTLRYLLEERGEGR